MTLAIFDLDNTLIAGDSDHRWGEFMIHKALVDADLYREKNDAFYRAYQDGTLDIDEYLHFSLAPFGTLSDADILELQREFMLDWVEPLMLKKAGELIDQHRRQNHQLLIITATNNVVTAPIAERLGIPALLASEAERGPNGFTGRPTGTPTFQHGKVIRLEQWLEKNPHPLEDAYFYSDSANDLPLLEAVGHPTAVDPDARLERIARERQWPILSLRD
ncbi:HAD family hydrolase [Marinimicrobium sp. ARAG 43.8]|uniref:histidinol-phosphatase n=1 Tax=Marinimicrobium sp. ARAG 43.8 TaxID=3418719 RepID=UPI003CEB6B1B